MQDPATIPVDAVGKMGGRVISPDLGFLQALVQERYNTIKVADVERTSVHLKTGNVWELRVGEDLAWLDDLMIKELCSRDEGSKVALAIFLLDANNQVPCICILPEMFDSSDVEGARDFDELDKRHLLVL